MSNNQYVLRQAFKAIKLAYAKSIDPVTGVGRNPIITPSDLRMEVLVTQNVNYYQFFALTQDANPSFAGGVTNTEIRLNQNDDFWAVLAGMYIALPSSAVSAQYKLYSYPNPTKFTAALAAVYDIFFNNCTLDIAINNVQYIQKFSTLRFRSTGVSQDGLGATSSTVAPAAIPSTLLDQFNGNDDGLTALGTLIQMSGQKKSDIKLNVPTGLSAAPAEFTRLVLIFRGFLALNAATR